MDNQLETTIGENKKSNEKSIFDTITDFLNALEKLQTRETLERKKSPTAKDKSGQPEANKSKTAKVGALPKAQNHEVFKICPGRFNLKLKKQFQNIQRVPSMLGKRFRSSDIVC